MPSLDSSTVMWKGAGLAQPDPFLPPLFGEAKMEVGRGLPTRG